MLQIRWRRWLTVKYVDAWLARGTYYQMQVLGDGTDNPDQRISQDLATFSSQTLNLVIGLISSVTTLAAFLAMLWNLSSQVAIPWHGAKIVIPGYLVWAAVLYSVCGTVITAVVGRRLIHLSFNQERFNADFRFSLVRIRENSESVALYRGEPREREHLLARFGEVFRNFWQIMRTDEEAELVGIRLRPGGGHLPRSCQHAGLLCQGDPDRHHHADLQRLRPGPGRTLVHREQLHRPCKLARGSRPACGSSSRQWTGWTRRGMPMRISRDETGCPSASVA